MSPSEDEDDESLDAACVMETFSASSSIQSVLSITVLFASSSELESLSFSEPTGFSSSAASGVVPSKLGIRDLSRKYIGGTGGSSDASLSEDESCVDTSISVGDVLVYTFEPDGSGCISFRTLSRYAIVLASMSPWPDFIPGGGKRGEFLDPFFRPRRGRF